MKVIEAFVPFQMAIKLKEKGLILSNEYIFGAYDEDGDLFSMLEYNIEEYWCAYAPTITQALKWLREEKKIHISIMLFMFKEGWCYEIIQIGENPKLITTQRNSCNTYEEAALAGIAYVLDNLI